MTPPRYRYLRVGEIIRRGDECMCGGHFWTPVFVSIGRPFKEGYWFFKVRRPLPAKKPAKKGKAK